METSPIGALYWGLTLGTIGKLVLGIAVLRVHSYILREHRIDKVVLNAIRRERYITALAIALMIIGYLLEMRAYSFISTLGL